MIKRFGIISIILLATLVVMTGILAALPDEPANFAPTAVSALNNLALDKPATSSSDDGLAAANAVDGDMLTRWSSDYADYEWLTVDLQQTGTITGVSLSWEAAYGKSYEIQVSDDALYWTSIYSTTTGNGGTDEITGLSGNGRYIRMYGIERATQWGFSLYEFEVYGTVSSGPPVCDPPIYSFETGIEGWMTAGYGDDSSTSVMTSTLHATDGNQSLKLSFDHDSSIHNKAVFMIENGAGIDLSTYTQLSFDLWKTGQPTQVALALSTGSGWTWHESLPQALNDGDNSVSFDLTSSEWKSDATGWVNNGTVQDLDDVKRIIVILLPSADGTGEAYLDSIQLCAPAPPLVCADPIFSFEGSDQGWTMAGWGDDSATAVMTSAEHATNGTNSLKLEFDHTAATHNKAIYMIESGFDFSTDKTINFDLWKSGEPAQVAIAITTGSGWAWHESTIQSVTDGDNHLSFDLTSNDWKSEATGWANTGTIADLNNVQRIAVLLFPAVDGAGEAYLDNMFLCAEPETPTAPSCGVPLYSFDSNIEGWVADTAGDSGAVSVEITETHATIGDNALQMNFDYDGSIHNKAIFKVEDSTGWDYTDYDTITIDLWKLDQPVQAALVVATGENWEWHESKPLPLYDGLNVLPFDLTSSEWKSNASGWAYTGNIADLDQVHRLAVVLFPTADGPGQAFLDNVRPCVKEGVVPLPPPLPEEFVSAFNTQFRVDSCQFYYVGTNNYYLPYNSEEMVDDVFDTASQLGMNVVRTWGFLDYGSVADGGVTVPHAHGSGPPNGVYFQYWDLDSNSVAINEEALVHLDYVLYSARQHNVKVILPLVNNWDAFGGMDQYVMWHGGEYHDEFYTDEAIKATYKAWINTLVNRVNTYTGLPYKEDIALMAWELANEPRCYGTNTDVSEQSGNCTTETITDWADEMSAYIKSLDENHMVSVGDEGFFNWGEDQDYPYSGYDGIDAEALLALPHVDFGTAHMYPQHWDVEDDVNWGVTWIRDHLDAGSTANKPVIIEEFGWQESTDTATRRSAYRAWTDAVYNGNGAGDNFWMLGGRLDDGSFYPDYDGYTLNLYDPDLATITLHAADMNDKNAVCSVPSVSYLPFISR